LWKDKLIVLLLIFIGCAGGRPRPPVQKGIINNIPSRIIKKQELTPVTTLELQEKLEPIVKIPEKKKKLFSFLFHKAKLADVLSLIAYEAGLNLSIDSEVNLDKPVTVKLENVTVEEALDVIVKKSAGYSWKIEGNSLFIERFEEYVYHFDYLSLTGKTDIEVGGDMLASGVEQTTVTGKYRIEAKTQEKADIWESIKQTLNSIKSQDGIVHINRTTGIIYIKDTPEKIKEMVNFLDKLSESLHRQVIIDAKVLEVTLSEKTKYGIDWNQMEIAFKSKWGGLPDDMRINFNSGYILLSKRSSLNAVLDFLKTQGDITILSNPHISVLNGQSALLTVGYQYPYGDIEGVDRDTETGLITYGTTIKRAVLGLQLGITPHISQDGRITLNIVPTITRIQQTIDVDVPVAAGQVQRISNPIIDLQELSTTVALRDGETLVLAGLISQVRKLNKRGLPILGDIPLLGRLFSRTEEEKQNRELVIFITPHIKR